MTGIVDHDRDGADVWSAALLKKEQERDALAARLAEAERRATTLQADLDRAIESALKANAINTDWRRDWKAAIARAEAAEARVRELEHALRRASERLSWLRDHHCSSEFARGQAKMAADECWRVQAGERATASAGGGQ